MTISTRDNVSLGYGALAIGFTTTKAKTVGAITYVINGLAYTKAATDDLYTLSGTALTTHQVCAFFLYLNAAGTASIEQSAIATASTASSGYVAGAFQWPDPVDKACIGALLVKSAGAVFTPGTTALTSVTTYLNVALDYGKPIAY